ncbi:DUF4255 domain-containing protein [Paraliomyxa miuraensis]|nr:DUF4255 domain-containing protein [Paraliomyxa miuraensis]
MEAELAVAITDISAVTSAITTLIGDAITVRDAPAEDFEVSAAPPEDDTVTGPNVISVHLFHIAEDSHRKNLLPTRFGGGGRVEYSPMGLVLNYVVTARNTTGTDGGARALAEQRWLGLVARTLHDFPTIDDSTQFPPRVPVLQTAGLSGDDNVVQLILRPVGIDDAINFWSAEQDLTARPSLFYEARVVLLATPQPPRVPGIVFSLGAYMFPGGPPQLLAIRNVVGFAPPAGTAVLDPADPFVRVPANPARASLFAAAPPATVDPGNAHVVLEGRSFVDERVLLALHGPSMIDAGPYAEQGFRLEVTRPADNPAWALLLEDGRIELDLSGSAQDDQARTVTLYPGIYRVQVITARSVAADVTGRYIEHSSNSSLFMVAPQISSVTNGAGPPNARSVTITLVGTYLRAELEVEVAVGGRVFTRVTGAPSAGTFDFSAGTGTISLVVDTTLHTGPIPVRLQINGAEATPAWVEP